MIAGKVWGKTALICSGPNFELHRIEINAGGYCSKHKHKTKANGFFCESGRLDITTWKPSGTVDVTHLNAGDFCVAPPGEYHQFSAPVPCVAFEVYWTALDPADIDREKEVWLKNGSLFDAIRASISLPLFFKPFDLNGQKLLDGGILNPVPIAPTFEDDTDLTIAINLGAPPLANPHPKQQTRSKVTKDSSPNSVSAKISNFIEDLKNRTPANDAGSWKMLGIADQTFDAMQGAIARQKLAAYPPDHTIMIARNACGTLEFDRADEMITLGYESASRCLGKS